MRNIIKKILKEDFDWADEHEFTQEEVLQHIKDNNITEWTFGEHWDGRLNLYGTSITNLGNLGSVGGDLYLYDTPITNLGNLESVGGYLNLGVTPITNLGNLESVGGNLSLYDTPMSEKYSEQEIRTMVTVRGNIYM